MGTGLRRDEAKPVEGSMVSWLLADVPGPEMGMTMRVPEPQATMKAVFAPRYGPPAVLELRDVAVPALTEDGVLVRVRATSVNPTDRHQLRGWPVLFRLSTGLRRPKRPILGTDLAGTVEAVGRNVTQVRVGDEVFCARGGAFAEYVVVPADRPVTKPANVTFEQAAGVPIAGITALQALRDWGQLKAGQSVLINGASGGVGTFAVQIAKALGARVTAVCSPRNVDLARSLGADRVIDYTKEDFARTERGYDLLLDIVGNRSFADCRRVLAPHGILVLCGAKGLGRIVKAILVRPFVRPKIVFHIATITHPDLVILRDLMEAGKVTPVVDRTYPLAQAPEALRYLEEGHARGKIVLTV